MISIACGARSRGCARSSKGCGNRRSRRRANWKRRISSSASARASSRFQTAQHELSSRQTQLAARLQALHQTRMAVEERRRSVAFAVKQKQIVLARLRTEESGTSQQLAALEEKARRLQRLIDSLSQQKSGGLAPQLDIRSVQGALAWPVDGTVIERFGRQRNPKFSTVTINN